jgi:hypothetical protein
MSKSPHDAARERAHTLILKGLQTYNDAISAESVPFLNNRIPVAKYHEQLTPQLIDDGVLAFILLTNMQAGSDVNKGFDLYNIMKAYILEPEKRKEINEISSR